MKPIKLKLRGFLTYKNEIEIDFTKLYNKKIFVISGDTGSGKTSIFDAISFALYGGVSRDIDPTRMRSDFLGPADPFTYVNLVFEVDGKIYEIERIPAQTSKKTKEGQNIKNAAVLYDITYERKILAEKIGDVNKTINQIIGLDQNQFSKVMLLAQGEFQQFLQAKSDERTKLLGDIFKTYEYKDIQDRIKEEASTASKSMNTIDERLENVIYRYEDIANVINRDDLLTHEFDQILESLISYKKENNDLYDDISKEENKVQDEQKELIGEIEAAKNLNANIDKFKEIEQNLEKKLEKKESYDDLKQNLSKAIIADSLLIYENQCRDYKNKLDDSNQRLTSLVGEEEKVNSELNLLKVKYDKLDKLQARSSDLKISYNENLKLLREAQDFVNIASKYGSLKNDIDKINILQDEYEKNQKELEVKKSAFEKIRDEINQLSNEGLEIQQNRLETETSLQKLTKDLESLKKNKENNLKISSNIDKIKDLEKQNQQIDIKVQNYYANQRYVEINKLIEELNHTGICPVCGDIHEQKFDKHDIESIDIDDLNAQVVKIISAINSLKAENELLKKSLIEVENEDKVEERLKIVKTELNDFNQKSIDLNKQIDDKNTRAKKLKAEIDANNQKVSEMKQSIADTEARAKEFEDTKVKYLANKDRLLALDIEKLKDSLRTMKAEAEKLDKSISEISSSYNSLLNTKSSLSTNISNIEENITNLQQDLDKSKADFREKVLDSFEGHDEYKKFKEIYKDLRQREEEISLYFKDLDRLTTLRENYKDFENKSYVDLDDLNKDLEEKSHELSNINEQRNEIYIKLSNIKQTIEEIEAIEKSYKEIKNEAETLAKLSKIADGSFAKIAGREKIDFETFVLTYYFDKVLAYANNRLYAMSNGKFKMVRNSNSGDMRKKQGLDIEIFDVNTGKTRPAATLSGGESFLASLSLALGLSDEISDENGGITIDTLFIDEGFGTLSEEYLNNVIEQIEKLSYESKFIGLISHVKELKDAIDAKILVTYTPEEGSFIEVDA